MGFEESDPAEMARRARAGAAYRAAKAAGASEWDAARAAFAATSLAGEAAAAQAASLPRVPVCNGTQTELILPRPVTQANNGLSMSAAYTCRRCELVIVPGISSSVATLSRRVQEVKGDISTLTNDKVVNCDPEFVRIFDHLVSGKDTGTESGHIAEWFNWHRSQLNEDERNEERNIVGKGGNDTNISETKGKSAAINNFLDALRDGALYKKVGDKCIQVRMKELGDQTKNQHVDRGGRFSTGVRKDIWDKFDSFFPTDDDYAEEGYGGDNDALRKALWKDWGNSGLLKPKETGYVMDIVPAGTPGALDKPESAKAREQIVANRAAETTASRAQVEAERVQLAQQAMAEGREIITYDYSAESKLFIRPSIPFRIRFNNETYPINGLTIYHPSPFRIENVQHDAILSLNDPSDPSARAIVLIPIVGGVMVKAAGRFVSKIVTYMSGVSEEQKDGKPVGTSIPTGHDWNLTSLLPLKIVDDEPRVQAGFFAFDSKPLEKKEKSLSASDDPCKKIFEWVPVAGAPDKKYIVVRQPIVVSHSDLFTIRRLPTTDPKDPIDIIPEKVVYQPGPADNCPECYGGGPGEVALPSFNVVPNNGVRNKNVVINILLGILSAVAIFIGIYFGVKWVTSDNGETFKWLGQKVGGFFGSFSAVGKSMGALAAPALVAMKKTSLPSFPMRRKSVAAAPAPAAPALPEMPSLSDVFPTPTTTPEASIKEFGLGDTIPIAPTGNFMVSNPLASRARTPRANMGPTASRANAQKQKEAAGTGLLSLGAMEALEEARATGKTPPGWRIKKNAAGEITDIKPLNLSGGHGGSTRRVRH